jgi:hypothetical protein
MSSKIIACDADIAASVTPRAPRFTAPECGMNGPLDSLRTRIGPSRRTRRDKRPERAG